jgi:hypothetical protein
VVLSIISRVLSLSEYFLIVYLHSTVSAEHRNMTGDNLLNVLSILIALMDVFKM